MDLGSRTGAADRPEEGSALRVTAPLRCALALGAVGLLGLARPALAAPLLAPRPEPVALDAPPHVELPCHQNTFECAWDYLELPARHGGWSGAARWGEQALTDWVQEARDQLRQPDPIQPDEADLPALLRGALDADWLWWRAGLFGGVPAPLHVGPLAPELPHIDGDRTHLWIADDVVGGFPAILLRPPGPGPHPAVLVTHGHNGDSHQSIDELGGAELARAGYVVLAPTYRVNGGSVVEDAVTRWLLAEGFSLLALRVYEQLLALRVLAALPDVDPARVGLMAHSGSNAAAMVTVRLAPWTAALVTDNECTYYSEGTDQADAVAELLDETFPALFPVHPALLRLDDLGIPALRVPYGTKSSLDEIEAFFDGALGPG
jgi:dienelactone hydrolase